jgi:hypothetical protein
MHSQPQHPGWNVENRVTVACKVEGGDIVYGLAICTAGDNFSRVKGRELATERMNSHYDVCQFSDGFYEQRFDGNEDKALQWFAQTIIRAALRNPQRYKNRLGNWEKDRAERLLNATKGDI